MYINDMISDLFVIYNFHLFVTCELGLKMDLGLGFGYSLSSGSSTYDPSTL